MRRTKNVHSVFLMIKKISPCPWWCCFTGPLFWWPVPLPYRKWRFIWDNEGKSWGRKDNHLLHTDGEKSKSISIRQNWARARHLTRASTPPFLHSLSPILTWAVAAPADPLLIAGISLAGLGIFEVGTVVFFFTSAYGEGSEERIHSTLMPLRKKNEAKQGTCFGRLSRCPDSKHNMPVRHYLTGPT